MKLFTKLFLSIILCVGLSQNVKAQTISTFANSGLNDPWCITIDGSGNLFVGNHNGNSISKITNTGVVSTFVNSGLNNPLGITIDGSGNLYVTNDNSQNIYKVTNSGSVSTFVSGGVITNFGTYGITIDGTGTLYVGNSYTKISKVTSGGSASLFVNSSGIANPSAFSFDGSGNLYVANVDINKISKVTSGGVVSTFANLSGAPQGLAFDAAGNLYAACNNNTIYKITNSGTVSTFVNTGLSNPAGLVFDASGNLYVTNINNNTVSKIVFPHPPTITSFTPANAKPGDAVTITGTNFNTTTTNNIVFFGATKATVTAATATSLTVTVPVGATYAPITELNTGTQLACYSLKNFNPIYSPAKTNLTSTDFEAKVDFAAGVPQSVAIGDLDGDGKPDLVVANKTANTISIYRNTGSSGSITSGNFASPVSFATDNRPFSVAIGDLDGDGKPDLAVSNLNSNTISVFRNTATSGTITSGSFASPVTFTTANAPYIIAIGDIDGDGKLDLAVTNYSSNSVSVFRNTATSGSITSGSFAAKIDFTTGGGPFCVALGDLDGDGKPDMVVADNDDTKVSVFLNTATSGSITSGSFAAKVDFSTGSGVTPNTVAIGDLDGDGKLDLAVTALNNTVLVFHNTATSGSITSGSFDAPVGFATGTTPYSVSIGDLDGDGKPDLAVANNTSNTISVFRNTATSGSITNSSFASKVDFATGTKPQLLAIGDLDGDGKPDLAVANNNSNTISVLRNADIILPPTITSFTPTNAKPGDAVTITGTNFNTTKTSNIVFFGATQATVTAATATSLAVTVPVGATYTRITELNTGNGLSCYSLKNFNPIYSPAKTSISSFDFAAKQDFTAGANPFSVAIGDLDGDGKPDLAVVNSAANTVSVYRNTSASGSITTGSFAAKVDFATGPNPETVTIGDLDGDGKLDLAVLNIDNNTISVFRNTSTSGSITTGSFAAKVDFTTGAHPYYFAIGDLDGDGKPDLAVANNNSSTVSILRNTSTSGSITTGSFAAKVDFTTGSGPYYVAIGDFDGDSKPDLAVANYVSATVSIFRNTSASGSITTGSFAAKVDFSIGTGSISIAIGDLDGDGKLDLAVANYLSNTVSILRNTSTSGSITSGSFAAKQDFTTGAGPSSVTIGDLDADSKPDLVVANYTSNTVSVFRNTSTSGSITSGSFAAKVDFATGTNPRSLAIGDLDGDGLPDLATANVSSSNVSILRNIIPNTLDKLSLTSATPASAAYSLRKLSTAYTGNAIQVRRSSDNSTQSIGFTAGGDLDTTALKTFAGSGDAFVVTWYDQSYFNDATQATAANQPRIVSAGVVERLNGKPAVNFLGAQTLAIPSAVMVTAANPSTLNCVAKLNYNTGWQWVVSYGGAYFAGGRAIGSTSADLVDISLFGYDNQGVNSTAQFIATGNYTNTGANLSSQNINPTGTASSAALSNAPNTGSTAAIIGAKVDNTEFWNGYIQEITLYNSSLSNTDNTAVQNSQTTYYSAPQITASNITSVLSTNTGTASATANFTVAGVNMLAAVLVTAPTGYEVSSSASGPFSSSVTVGAAGTIASTTVYIRIASSTAIGTYNSTIALTSSGATTVQVMVGGSVLSALPAISYGVSGTQIFSPGTTITPLTLTNTGGAVLAQGGNVQNILAGTNANGSLDGPAASATFNGPAGLAVDASGNVYVADQGNYKIRKITGGSVSSFAGTGTAGSIDGSTASATFNYPTGLAIDALGNLFVGDNNRVRKINAGSVSTLSGTSITAQAIAVDAAGNIYMADPYGNVIRKITPESVVTIFAGSGSPGAVDATGVAASFNHPSGLAVDGLGNVYVADANNNTIRKITAAGVVSTFAGSGTRGELDGTGTAALFTSPTGIATDAVGNIYVADFANGAGTIRKITPAAVVTTISTGWQYPQAVAVDKAFNVYWALGSGSAGNQIISFSQQGYSISPALPFGLRFDSTNGNISGTPTAYSPATTYTITATNAGGSSSTTLSIQVTGSITAGTASGTMSTCVGSASVNPKIQQFTVSGSFLTDNILVTAPANFEVSLASGPGYGSTVTLNQSGGTVNSTTVYVRLAAAATTGNKADSVVLTSAGGVTTQKVGVAGTVYAYPVLGPILGTKSVCVGNQTTLTAATPASVPTDTLHTANPKTLSVSTNTASVAADQTMGNVTPSPLYLPVKVWSSDNLAVATVDANTGVVTGVSAGTATITCSLSGLSTCVSTQTALVTVNALPVVPAITGNTMVILGSTSTLSNAVTGGVWSSNNTSISTVDPNSGIVSAVALGADSILYTVSTNGCSTTVKAASTVVGSITGISSFCVGATSQLADATTGGVWSSTNTATATVDVNGMVTGVSGGIATINYTLSGIGVVTKSVTVNALPVVPAITGAATVLVNSTTPLANTVTGGVWTSSNTAAATINASTGVVSGIAAGITTITYTVTNSSNCVTAVTTLLTAVAIAPITGTTNVCAGSTTQLADATAGGSWSSSDISKATIDATGKVTGIIAGNITISYTITGIGAVTTAFTVNALPTGTITAAGGAIICGTGGSVVLTASGGNSYAWKNGTTAITSTTTSQLTATTTGVYTVTVTNTTTGCSAPAGNSITVSQLFAPKASFVNDFYCVNKPITFTNQSTVGTSGPVNYVWSDNNGNSSSSSNASFTYSSVGSYSVKLKVVPQACPNIADSSIKIIAVEAAVAGVRYTRVDAVINNPTPLQARSFGVAYLWSPATALSDATIANPTVKIKIETDYSISITAASGCVTIDNVLVRAFGANLYVPNVFSPNGDGVNDVLYVNLINVKQLKFFRIYDRWGKKLFETNDPTQGWDGKTNGVLQHLDTYTWVAEAMDNNGAYITKEGNVTLLR